jgi:Fe-S-cluster containining protein
VPHSLPTLDAAEASAICLRDCQAHCCQGPAFVRLSLQEGQHLSAFAAALGAELLLRPAEGGFELRFPDHEGERCPFLEEESHRCRVYQERPAACRDFPGRLRDGCPLSERLFQE